MASENYKNIISEDYCKIIESYNKIFPKLSDFLNKNHGLNKTSVFWEVLLSPSLLNLFSIVKGFGSEYDLPRKYHRKPVSLIPPWDAREIIVKKENKEFEDVLGKEDESNLILNDLGEHEYFNVTDEILFKLSSGVLCADYFLPKNVSRIIRREFSLLNFCRFPKTTHGKILIDKKLREKMVSELLKEINDEESVKFVKSLYWGFPASMLEGFHDLFKRSEKNAERFKCVIYSNQYWEECGLLFLMANVKENGGILIGRPHGGFYGQITCLFLEYFERILASYYITPGWHESTHGKEEKCIPMTEPRLCSISNSNTPENEDVIWVSNAFYKDVLFVSNGFPMPSCVSSWYDSKNRFYEILPENIKANLKYRPFPCTYGWDDEEKYFKSKFNEENILSKGRLNSYLFSCKMVLIDHPCTVLQEAMAINVPMIIFWDKSLFTFRDDMSMVMDKLSEAGIYHSSPASFSKKIDEIYDNPSKWWNSKEIQEARNLFMHYFARVTGDYAQEWGMFANCLKKACYKGNDLPLNDFIIAKQK